MLRNLSLGVDTNYLMSEYYFPIYQSQPKLKMPRLCSQVHLNRSGTKVLTLLRSNSSLTSVKEAIRSP